MIFDQHYTDIGLVGQHARTDRKGGIMAVGAQFHRESPKVPALDMDVPLHPEAEIIDARTVRFHGKDFLEAWIRARR